MAMPEVLTGYRGNVLRFSATANLQLELAVTLVQLA
jgi:hypothetical protein